MPSTDYTRQLHRVVDAILDEYELKAFEQSWDLSQDILSDLPVRKFFASADHGYGNVGIITDDLLIDVEGSDNDPEDSGGLSVQKLSAISGVSLAEGPVAGIKGSDDALLVLQVYVAGSEVVERYWSAETEEEREYLLEFSKTLTEAMTS